MLVMFILALKYTLSLLSTETQQFACGVKFLMLLYFLQARFQGTALLSMSYDFQGQGSMQPMNSSKQ